VNEESRIKGTLELDDGDKIEVEFVECNTKTTRMRLVPYTREYKFKRKSVLVSIDDFKEGFDAGDLIGYVELIGRTNFFFRVGLFNDTLTKLLEEKDVIKRGSWFKKDYYKSLNFRQFKKDVDIMEKLYQRELEKLKNKNLKNEESIKR